MGRRTRREMKARRMHGNTESPEKTQSKGVLSKVWIGEIDKIPLTMDSGVPAGEKPEIVLL